jgi:hypothetical protein
MKKYFISYHPHFFVPKTIRSSAACQAGALLPARQTL